MPSTPSAPFNDDRRSSKRIDARIQVDFRNEKEFVQCYSQNLSKGGIYLETPQLPDPNANIELSLHLPASANGGASEEIRLMGKVVRLMSISVSGQTVHKVALQFVDVSAELQAKLDALYHHYSKA
jgi:hypothetical protein